MRSYMPRIIVPVQSQILSLADSVPTTMCCRHSSSSAADSEEERLLLNFLTAAKAPRRSLFQSSRRTSNSTPMTVAPQSGGDWNNPMKRLDDVLAWYQGKIGNYDKQSWEQSVEQRILQGLENRPKKDVSLKSELIDVDLVRGSAFTKAKPQHGWSAGIIKGFFRVFLMPFWYSYWRQHTSARIAKYILFHYFLQLLQLALYMRQEGTEASFEELMAPLLLSLALGVLHAQIISPHGVKKKKPLTSSKNNTKTRKTGKTKPRRRRKVKTDEPTSATETLEDTEPLMEKPRQPTGAISPLAKPNTASPPASPTTDPTVVTVRKITPTPITGQRRTMASPILAKLVISSVGSGGISGSTEAGSASSGGNSGLDPAGSSCMSASLDPIPVVKSPEEVDETVVDPDIKKFIDAKNKQIPDPVAYPTCAGGDTSCLSIPALPGSSERRRHRSHRASSHSGDGFPVTPCLPVPVATSTTGGSGVAKTSFKGVSRGVRSKSETVTNGSHHYDRSDDEEKDATRVGPASTSPARRSHSDEDDEENGGLAGQQRSSWRRQSRLPPTLLSVGFNIDPGQQSHGHSADASTSDSDGALNNEVFGEDNSGAAATNVLTYRGARGGQRVSPEGGLVGAERRTNGSGASTGCSVGFVETLGGAGEHGDVMLAPPQVRQTSRRRRRRSSSYTEQTTPNTNTEAAAANIGVHQDKTPPVTIRNFDIQKSCLDDSMKERLQSSLQSGQQLSNEDVEALGNLMPPTSNDDTITSNMKQKQLFEQIFRLRSLNAAGLSARRGPLASSAPNTPQAASHLHHLSSPLSLDLTARSPVVAGGAGKEEDSSNETDAPVTAIRETLDTLSPKHQPSETEYDRMNSDIGSSNNTSTSGEERESLENVGSGERVEDPFVLWYKETHNAGTPHSTHTTTSTTEAVSCYVWEGDQLKKVDLTLLDIGWSIIQAVERHPLDTDYPRLGFFTAFFLSLMPLFYRGYINWPTLQKLPNAFLHVPALHTAVFDIPAIVGVSLFGSSWNVTSFITLGVVLRFGLYIMVFFLLCVAERTFEHRLQYAKHFCYLTSSRRARKYYLPHFRLNKVRNIKFWLSLRSYLKKRGPQRSVDSIITAAFYLVLALMSVLCFHLLSDGDAATSDLICLDLTICSMALSVFLLRFLTLGTKISKKYRNLSVLITEQINLYLAVEKKPHKKEELMLANNVLKLAENLLKEVDGPFRVCGWSINPLVYNILKVVILSGCSTVLSRHMGFKLKLYKIRLNPANW